MSDDENFTCDKCNKSFDSERGLHIHQSQVHSEEETTQEDEEDNNIQEPEKSDTVSISVNQALIGVFVLGITLGFAGGIVANTIDFSALTEESTVSVMQDIGNDLDINTGEMKNYIESNDGSEISQDKTEIEEITGGLGGTPTFFIGNSETGYTQVAGALPYSRMKPVIDAKIQQATNNNTTVGEEEYTLSNISFEGEPTLGSESSKINIIEYTDYGCPWCAEWHGVNAVPQRPIDQSNSFENVRTNYVETGEVQFIMKDYPVQRLHPEAPKAHLAANYVLENNPDKFWEFSQRIYETRDRW
jgi:protein-disulfide isomerase